MKPILFILLVSCLFTCNSTSDSEPSTIDHHKTVDGIHVHKHPKNDLSKSNLKSKVSSLEEWEYKAIVKEGYVSNGNLRQGIKLVYNKEGNEEEKNHYNSKKIIVRIWTNKYDANGHCIERLCTTAKDTTQSVSIYDENGKQVELIEYVGGDQVGKTTYLYDLDGHEMESNATYDEQGTESKNRIVYNYDEQGNKTEGLFYNEDAAITFKYYYDYDANGNELERAIFTGDNAPSFKYTKKYDSKRQVIERQDFNEDGSLSLKRTYEYNEKGNIVKELSFEGNSEINVHFCSKYTYEYDKKGNWIVKIRYDYDAIAQEFTERKIAYYD
jgi:hypothetical protein